VSSAAYQTVPVTCPNCNNRFVSPVLAIVDAGENPEAKALLLSGQLNVAACPQCGHVGRLSSPLVYHDPEKELLFTFVPSELALPDVEQQRLIGDLTNQVMSRLAPEQRKGYLLRPQSFLRMEGLIEAILKADGVTPEMLEAQRAKASLLDRLMHTSSRDARRVIAEENDSEIDYDLLQFLTLNIELAQAGGPEDAVQQLLKLRQELLEWTTAGRDIAAREEAIRELGTEISRETLLEKLVHAALAGEKAKVETMVAIGRPAIDYVFYQQLTNRIEAASHDGKPEEAQTLKMLREDILNLTAEIDAELQRASEDATELLQQILRSDDLEQAVQANLAQIDDLFLNVLGMSLQEAEKSGQAETAEKLQKIGDTIMRLIEEMQPPEVQLINRLLATEYPVATQELLGENRPQVNPRLVEIMQMIEEDLTQNGRTEMAQRLSKVRAQAEAMLGDSA
jgi:hypothetical protein